MHVDAEPVPGYRPRDQIAAEQRYAFAHADQAAALRRAVGGVYGPRPIIADLQIERPFGKPDQHTGVRGAGVLHAVGQRFLHNPIGGNVERLGQLLHRAFDAQRHRQTGGAAAVGQALDLREARLRRTFLTQLVVVPQHRKQRAHLRQRLPTGVLNGLERLQVQTIDRYAPPTAALSRETAVPHDPGCYPQLQQGVQVVTWEREERSMGAGTGVSLLPSDRQAEVAEIIQRFGDPLVHPVELGTAEQWDRRARLYEVCMVVRRPSGGLLTARKTFYLPGLYRLLTGGVEPGERIVDALLREVDEETSLAVSVGRFLAIVAYHAEGPAHTAPRAYTFAFLLDEHGGTLAPRDLEEQLAGYGEVAVEDLPELADNLDSLPDAESPELGETWRAWGRYRAVLHRAVWEALTRHQGSAEPS